jgi:hypothetical protein
MSSVADGGPAKGVGKIALLGLDDASAAVLAECFRQFSLEATSLPMDASGTVAGSYDACVVPLNGKAEGVLREIRKVNHRIVVYGTCGSTREALRFAKWGINAVFHTPIGRHEALQVVRATHLLVLQELRRYVRVPLVCPVTLESGIQMLEASSLEISAGGMALATTAKLSVPQTVLASFALPGTGDVRVRSVVCWTRDYESTAAIRFDPGDGRRVVVRQWIDEYLGA